MNRQVTTSHFGRDLALVAADDRFVSRASRDALEQNGFEVEDQLSTQSFSVRSGSSRIDADMRRARELGAAAYPHYSVGDTNRDFLISDRVFVRFRDSRDEPGVAQFAHDYDATVDSSYDGEVLLKLRPDADPVQVVRRMMEDGRVALAEHDLNHLVQPFEAVPPSAAVPLVLPADVEYRRQWHLHDKLAHAGESNEALSRDERRDREAFRAEVSTHCEEAWKSLNNYGSPGVVVGLTDGGVDLMNPDFRSTAEKFAGWGYFRGSWIRTNLSASSVIAEMAESPFHGTAMAGLIGAAVNGEFAVGVAPSCRLLPIRFETEGRRLLVATSRVRTAFRFLSSRADVISNSWGTGESSLWGRMFCEEIERIATRGGRRGLGAVIVWAAGNSNCPIARNFITDQDVPIDNGRDALGRFIGPKTARRFRNDLVGIPGVIHVGAIDSRGRRSHYSNYGSGLRLCAPSDNLHLYGCDGIVDPPSLPIQSSPVAGVLQTAPGGTSTATAIVSGVAALVISANPTLTSEEVVSILQKTANKKLDTTAYRKAHEGRCNIGESRFDVSPIPPFDTGEFRDLGYPDGTWSPWFGYGSVNAAKAVEMAKTIP